MSGIDGTKQKSHKAVTSGGSALSRYQKVIVGRSGVLSLLYFELCMLLAPLPGALGLLLRKLLWPRLFRHCGRGVQFATGVVLRHPGRIVLGDNVIVSEGVLLDARNEERDEVITVGNDCILANGVVLQAKGGTIQLGDRVGVGSYTVLHSIVESPVTIGDDVIIGCHSYVIGGGSYDMTLTDMPMWQGGNQQDGGVKIGDNVWFGARVSVIGGVDIAAGGVFGIGAVVTKSTEADGVYAGVPAKFLRNRFDT